MTQELDLFAALIPTSEAPDFLSKDKMDTDVKALLDSFADETGATEVYESQNRILRLLWKYKLPSSQVIIQRHITLFS